MTPPPVLLHWSPLTGGGDYRPQFPLSEIRAIRKSQKFPRNPSIAQPIFNRSLFYYGCWYTPQWLVVTVSDWIVVLTDTEVIRDGASCAGERDWGRIGKESATAFVRDPFQHSPGVISENHGKPTSAWQDRESNPSPPECESSELPLRLLARIHYDRILTFASAWYNTKMFSSLKFWAAVFN
ncbi:hypothetical protein PR048_016822 [Dryococelus australis]|uniref:Uncharacterized protein n=1 Tax=Dryococelus australis TaxID=614101 RepID=A0ABQ9H7S0_9NEOP|nr:hypothetical protein PR048_016822 [Dryococelus australis]